MNTRGNRWGFTVTEALTPLFVCGLVLSGVFACIHRVIAQTKAGSSQARFLAMGHAAQQEIAGYIHEGKAVSVQTNAVLILQTSDEISRIDFYDQDDNPLTVSNNWLRYDPNIRRTGDEKRICNFIRPVDGTQIIFTNTPSSPTSVHVEFHVGDSTDPNDPASRSSGEGYQGVEVRFSAAPRNLQYWYR